MVLGLGAGEHSGRWQTPQSVVHWAALGGDEDREQTKAVWRRAPAPARESSEQGRSPSHPQFSHWPSPSQDQVDYCR